MYTVKVVISEMEQHRDVVTKEH